MTTMVIRRGGGGTIRRRSSRLPPTLLGLLLLAAVLLLDTTEVPRPPLLSGALASSVAVDVEVDVEGGGGGGGSAGSSSSCLADGTCPSSSAASRVDDTARVEDEDEDEGSSDDVDDEESSDDSSSDDDDEGSPASSPCSDENDQCQFWADAGECRANPGYMLIRCKLSCNVCDEGGGDGGGDQVVEGLIKEGGGAAEEREHPEMRFGERQTIEGTQAGETRRLLSEIIVYMETEVAVDPKYSNVRSECKNRNALCAFWAVIGECDANPAFMTVNCAPSCKTCHLVDFDTRCPFDPNDKSKDALGPGDLNRMFESIVDPTNEEVAVLKPVVLSRPPPTTPSVKEVEEEEGGVVVTSDADHQTGPWVVTFDDFLTEEECDRMIELGQAAGYERSTDVGGKKFDGTYEAHKSSGRTSENAWCKDECMDDPVAVRVTERISNVTGIPSVNSEHFQILRYELGQQYKAHHDYIPHQRNRKCGPRVLTFFLYLSDVEGGGGTNFPNLDEPLTVMPKKGKALLWPSVLDEDPSRIDERTRHAALPVEAGVKFAANAWIHLRDFKTANREGCS